MVNGLYENTSAMLYNVMIMLWKIWKDEEWQEWTKERMINERMKMNAWMFLRYLMTYVWMNDGTKLRVRMAAILYGPLGMAHLSAP